MKKLIITAILTLIIIGVCIAEKSTKKLTITINTEALTFEQIAQLEEKITNLLETEKIVATTTYSFESETPSYYVWPQGGYSGPSTLEWREGFTN